MNPPDKSLVDAIREFLGLRPLYDKSADRKTDVQRFAFLQQLPEDRNGRGIF
jgi:hypothetical protein